MKSLKKQICFNIFTVFFLIAFAFSGSGCSSTMEKIGVYIDENPVLVNIATSQVVTRYIEEGDTLEDKKARAEGVQYRINKVLAFIDGNPETTIDGLLLVIDQVVDWDKLSHPDRLLVKNIIMLAEAELRKYELEDPGFNKETRFSLKTLFNIAVVAAEIYLE